MISKYIRPETRTKMSDKEVVTNILNALSDSYDERHTEFSLILGVDGSEENEPEKKLHIEELIVALSVAEDAMDSLELLTKQNLRELAMNVASSMFMVGILYSVERLELLGRPLEV